MKETFDTATPLAALFVILKGIAGLYAGNLLIPAFEIGAGMLAFRMFLRFIEVQKQVKNHNL